MNDRFTVFTVLREWERSSLFLDSITERANLSHFAFRLVKGVVEKKMYLDHAIQQFVSRKPSDDVRIILRIAFYELLFNTSAQPYATVHEAVNLTSAIEPSGKGFVNAVLRSFLRADKVVEIPQDPIQRLSVEFSYPCWIIELFLTYYSYDDTRMLLQYNEDADYCDIRVNTKKIDVHSYCLLLETAEIAYERDDTVPFHVRLFHTGNIQKLPGFHEGYFYVQDIAAQSICALALPLRGSLLDVGSAPGGKISYFSHENPSRYPLYALDSSSRRIRRLHENLHRLGVDDVTTIESDFLSYKPDTLFTHIFIDAPCSGLGVLHGKADIKYRLQEKDIESLRSLQLGMLIHAAGMLAPDGEIIYSTCTLNRYENQETIKEFLKAKEDYHCLPLSEKNCLRSSETDGIVSEGIWFEPFPPRHRMAGMFAVKMKR